MRLNASKNVLTPSLKGQALRNLKEFTQRTFQLSRPYSSQFASPQHSSFPPPPLPFLFFIPYLSKTLTFITLPKLVFFYFTITPYYLNPI